MARCARRRSGITVQVAAVQRRQSAGGVRQGIRGLGQQPAPLRPHDLRRDSQGPAQPRRRRPHQLAFSSDRDGERQRGTVDQRGIKEIYIADYDGANPRRITVNRSLNIFPVWSADGKAIAYTSYRRNNMPDIFVLVHLPGPPARDARQGHRSRAQLPAGVVARRIEDRVHDQPRRQPRDLLGQPRRQRRAASHQPSGHRRDADVVALRQPGGVHVRSVRLAADLHHAMPTDWANRVASRRSRAGPIARPGRRRHTTRSRSPRARARATTSRFTTWPPARCGRSPTAKGQQREPGLLADRPPPGVLILDPLGQAADLHHRPRRQRPAADHEGRQQLASELVALGSQACGPTFPLASTTRLGDSTFMQRRSLPAFMLALVAAAAVFGCGKKVDPVARPTPPPPSTVGRPPAPPEPIVEPPPVTVPPEPAVESSDLEQPVARRDQQARAAAAGVLRVRQRRDERRRRRPC